MVLKKLWNSCLPFLISIIWFFLNIWTRALYRVGLHSFPRIWRDPRLGWSYIFWLRVGIRSGWLPVFSAVRLVFSFFWVLVSFGLTFIVSGSDQFRWILTLAGQFRFDPNFERMSKVYFQVNRFMLEFLLSQISDNITYEMFENKLEKYQKKLHYFFFCI